MNIRNLIASVAIAMAGILGVATAASAYDAAATTTLNVRSGPGTNFNVIGALQRNQVVNIVECNSANTWCRIRDRNIDGWASNRYLQPIAGTSQRPRPVRPGQPGVGITIGDGNFSFSIGTGTSRPGVRPGRRGQVCFYEEYNFNGRSFCARDGQSARTLERFWDNRIRSIRVSGNSAVTVCSSRNLSGRCAVVDRSMRNIGFLANNVSSYRVSR